MIQIWKLKEHFGYYKITIEQPLFDEEGNIVKDKKGKTKVDSRKRDKENVPLGQDIELYFEREVKPHLPNAWIDFDKTRIGYDINFTKYFYEHQTLRPSSQIKAEIEALEFGQGNEKGITQLLKELLM